MYDGYSYDISQYARSLEDLEHSLESLENSTTFWGILGAFFGAYFAIFLINSVLQIIEMWRIFKKAGEKGWKSIIPIYNIVILYRISGVSPWLILVFLASIIPFVGWIAILIVHIYQINSLAKSFGKDIGYTIGLLFLGPIFYMILGFGDSKYVGTPYNKNSKSNNSDTVIETQTIEDNNEDNKS